MSLHSDSNRDTFLFAGATGLVGGLTLKRLLADTAGPRLLVIGRRATQVEHPRVEAVVADLADSEGDAALAARLRAISGGRVGVFLCALGTTRRAAGSRAAFRAVDLGLVLRLGAIARELGARQALVVSSVGADPQALNVYLRTKGEVERGIDELGFERCDFLRPSLLLGQRGERRFGERLAQKLSRLYDPLLRGAWRRYRAISADTVAAALVTLAGRGAPGCYVHENDAIAKLARGVRL